MNNFTLILSAITLAATLTACSKSTDESTPTTSAQGASAAVQEETKTTVEAVKEKAVEKVEEVKAATQEKVEEVKEAAIEKVGEIKESAADELNTLKDKY